MRSLVYLAIAAAAASPAFAQVPDKSGYSLTNPTPREALRELSTDRPDKTESPYTVDAGHVQIELDFANYTREHDKSGGGNIRSETIGLVPFNLKVGLTNGTDLQLLVETYIRQTVTDRTTGRRERISGFGDVTLRLKHNLWGNDGGRTALALMPFAKLPTNSNNIGNDAVEFGLIVPVAISVSEGISIGLMTEVDILEESDGSGYAPSFINSATVAFDLTDRLGLYTEIFTERSSERDARWAVTGDAGLTFAVSDNVQLDAGINIGITNAADDLNLFIGISSRY
ncbi:MAG TPA: transporter [Sphingomicrobium sp.]|nr:transporter [Sphingomicrobium sp.]